MKQPVAYLRKSKVSSDRHVSWDVQEAEIRAMAARAGDSEALVFLSDWGRSGRGEKTRLRPEYLRLRAMIEADEVSVLYAYSLSRLARSLGEYANLAELCQAHGVRVRLAKEGEFDYSSASGRFTVGILALLAQMEAELAQERARDTIALRRARGDHIGSAGYGKRLVRGQLRDDPKQDVAVVEAAYREAQSFGGAAKLLNEAGHRSKQGRAWSQTAVARTLRREAPSAVERPVERGVAQRSSFALSRLLRCPCGNVMTGRSTSHTTKYGSYGPYVSYQCYRGRYDPTHQRPYMVSERDILEWVQAEAARLAIKDADALSVDEGAVEHGRLLDRRQRIIDNYEDGLIDKLERDRKLAAIGEEAERLTVATMLVDIPQQVDWSWPTARLNAVLRGMWRSIELGPDLRPIRAEWILPEWRA
jgi:DNA invertase Pin-like site-specific DNA recombinase